MLDLLLRLMHIFAAIFLAGGVFFMWCALVPALGLLGAEDRASLEARIRASWSKVVMTTSGLLLLSGLVNAVRIILANEFPPGSVYHALVAIKLLLALAIFWITATLSGRSEGAEKFRQKMPFWLNVNAILLICLICVASVMKTSERVPKTADAPNPAATQAIGD